MFGKPLATSENTWFVRRSQCCQTLYVGPPDQTPIPTLPRQLWLRTNCSLMLPGTIFLRRLIVR